MSGYSAPLAPGESLNLHCRLSTTDTSRNITLLWSFTPPSNNTINTNTIQIGSGVFFNISRLRGKDRGTYTCNAEGVRDSVKVRHLISCSIDKVTVQIAVCCIEIVINIRIKGTNYLYLSALSIIFVMRYISKVLLLLLLLLLAKTR